MYLVSPPVPTKRATVGLIKVRSFRALLHGNAVYGSYLNSVLRGK